MKTIILSFSILTITLITILIVALKIDITDFVLTIVLGVLISIFLSALEFDALYGNKSLFNNALYDIHKKFRPLSKVLILAILVANLIAFPTIISFRYHNQKSSFYFGFKQDINEYFAKIKLSELQSQKIQVIRVDYSNERGFSMEYFEQEDSLIHSLQKGKVLVGSIDESTGNCIFDYDLNSYLDKRFIAFNKDSISNLIIVEKDYGGTNFRYTDGSYGLRCITNIYFLDPKTSIILLKLEIVGSDPPSIVKKGEPKKGLCASDETIAQVITGTKTYFISDQ